MHSEPTQDLLSLPEVAHRAPGNPSPCTVWRWCRKGILPRGGGQRIRLEHVRAGSRIFVPREALGAFFRATAEADAPHFADPAPSPRPAPVPPGDRSPEARERAASEAAERIRNTKPAA